MKARVNGTEIYFDIEGSGLIPVGNKMVEKRPCFVLHGGPGADHSYFKPWVTPLAEDMQLIYVDHRGNGRSARMPSENYTIDAMADDLEALRQMLGLDQVALMGNSFGGMVALWYATKYPANVSHLVLVTTAPSHEFWRDAQGMAEKMATPEQKRVLPLPFEGKIASDEEYAKWWEIVLPLYFYRFDAEIGRSFNDRIVHCLEVSNWMFKNEIPKYDLRPKLGAITARTLIIGASHDWVTPIPQSEEMARLIPGSRLVIFEKSGHMPFIEENEGFIELVRDFVRRAS